MPTPRKPIELMTKHLDKETKKTRAFAEEELLTGESWREYPEVRNNAIANKFFKRLTDLYSRIDKNDAMTEPIINRYCIIQAECYDFEAKREQFSANLDSLIDNDTLEDKDKFKLEVEMQKTILGVDSAIQAKRKMLLDIEREMLLTLKGQLASIPKKKEEKPKNKFSAFGGENLG